MKRFLLAFAIATFGLISPASAATPNLGAFPFLNAALDAGTVTMTPPTSNSPGTWSFTADDPTIVTFVGGVGTMHRTGYTRITATQAASGSYTSASRVGGLLVTIGNPSIAPWADQSVMYLAKSYQIVPPKSKSSVAFTYTLSNPRVASVDKNGLLTLLDVGTTSVIARQAASVDWTSGTATMTLTVKGPKTIAAPVITAPSALTFVYGDPDFQIAAPTSESTGAFTYSSSNNSVISITGSTAHIVGAGTATINISQGAAGYYLAGTSSFTVTVIGFVPTITAPAAINLTIGAQPVAVVAPTSDSNGTWSYSVLNPKIAKLENGALTPLAAGSTILRAVQSAAGKYTQSNIIQIPITVIGATPSVSASATPSPSTTIKPTSTIKPTPSIKPSATPKPSPTATATTKPVAKATPTPVATKSTTVVSTIPVITVSVKAKVLHVSSNDQRVSVYIDGRLAKLGANTLKSGAHIVIVSAGATILYSRTITIA